MLKNAVKIASFWALGIVGTVALQTHAQGFLELPELSEVPEYERESLLLDLDIPPVSERDPDPEAGPRLNVKEFRLQGLVEFPSLGITREDLVERVESIRFDLMEEGELTDSGYTLEELSEISDLISEIEKDTEDEHVGPLEVQKLVFLIREQRRSRGVTLGMIETVADTITRYYRERGFVLAKAYIPQQRVRDGIVTLTLLLGELGEVTAENNKRVSQKLVQRVFKSNLNKPVTSWETEEALYLVNDIPGVSAQGFFQPGSQVGDTRLSVNVLSEKRYTTNFRIDNHGSPRTGEQRAYADFALHNPLGIGDELRLSLLNTFSPDNTTFGGIRYSTFLFSPRFRGEVNISTNDFVSFNRSGEGQSAINTVITGKSNVGEASFKYIFKRSRVKNTSLEIKATTIATDVVTDVILVRDPDRERPPGESSGSDTVNVSVNFNFDILNERLRQLYLGRVGLVQSTVDADATGLDSGGGNVFRTQEDGTLFLEYDVAALAFWTIPFIKANTRFFVKSAGQYGGEVLNSINQFNLTGPDRVRGYEVNTLQFDDGAYVGIDWIFNLPKFGGASILGEPINKIFQPFIFGDVGGGISYQRSNNDPNDATGLITSAGLGVKFNLASFSGSLTFANALTDSVRGGIETPTNSVLFDMQYSF